LRYALSTAPLNSVVQDGLRRLWEWGSRPGLAARIGWRTPERALWVLPRHWQGGLVAVPGPAVFYEVSSPPDGWEWGERRRSAWTVVANGRFAAYADPQLLERLVRTTRADGLAVTVAPDLLACGERTRLTCDNRVVGYQRLYADSMSPAPLPTDWPHFLLLRRAVLDTALHAGLLCSFGVWADRSRAAGLRLQGARVAGSVYDLDCEEGIWGVSSVALSRAAGPVIVPGSLRGRCPTMGTENADISPDSHLIGPVRLGERVTIAAGAVVVGPAVLCDGCTIGPGAVVDSAIVGPRVSVAPGQRLGHGVVTTGPHSFAPPRRAAPTGGLPQTPVSLPGRGVFRTWPRFSYARCFKRIADVVAAVAVSILFAPVFPIIALAVKISSPGPVFFRDRRQGLHGRPFHCVKFRTMRQGADQMQDQLRFVSEVDGPQFKMADDPRITAVGRFLRETYLDEIPQFFNVLCGQMSVVGPRPSPEAENRLCPSWRDARLSVRPGITGLWQVLRTREPQQDFQEWIRYDTRYVRDFSFGLDLWICWRTFRKMIGNFVNQF
jgi:lipopolysaccharide/colanic/teichoic acid biosynthesis glycosyltransferase